MDKLMMTTIYFLKINIHIPDAGRQWRSCHLMKIFHTLIQLVRKIGRILKSEKRMSKYEAVSVVYSMVKFIALTSYTFFHYVFQSFIYISLF